MQSEVKILRLVSGEEIMGIVSSKEIENGTHSLRVLHPLEVHTEYDEEKASHVVMLRRWQLHTDDPVSEIQVGHIMTNHNPIQELEEYYYQRLDDLFLFVIQELDESNNDNSEEHYNQKLLEAMDKETIH